MLNAFTGILGGLTVFSYMGYTAKSLGLPDVSALPLTGIDLAFIAYPTALTLLPFPSFWAILFFLMLIFLGLDTQFAFVECISGTLEDEKLSIGGVQLKPIVQRILICLAIIIGGLPLLTDVSLHLLKLYDTFSMDAPLTGVVTIEIFIYSMDYSLERLANDIKAKTDQIVPRFIIFLLDKVSLPLYTILFLVALYSLIFHDTVGLPIWAAFLGWSLTLIPFGVILSLIHI
eukprot:TRINITY_DN4195_c0_g2_i4.p2 TRINITY_DN4195_c0_g2~~TRINITY_DN4195_c0_g2_i4.p2  ORF type:complete len:231 (+),score=25.58 TRINITY_DN4195_c0_g2_i4:980-1672(+)